MSAIRIDVNDLTLGEVEEFEEQSGLTLSDLEAGQMTTKGVLALVCITKRREDPDYTMDDARKVKLADFVVGADPTPAEAE